MHAHTLKKSQQIKYYRTVYYLLFLFNLLGIGLLFIWYFL